MSADRVEVVELDALASVLMLHQMWVKSYWHNWEHIEHAWAMDVGYTIEAMDQAIHPLPRRGRRR